MENISIDNCLDGYIFTYKFNDAGLPITFSASAYLEDNLWDVFPTIHFGGGDRTQFCFKYKIYNQTFEEFKAYVRECLSKHSDKFKVD
jgi:hypothetical protein